MAYTTIANVKLNHEMIPDTAASDAIIAMHIPMVDSYIDGKLRGKFELPFTTTPALIQMIALDLVTFRTLRSLYSAQSESYDSWLDEYKNPAEEKLQDIADCKISFDSSEATQRTRIQSNTSGKEAIFNLLDPIEQDYHPTDGDDRYGEE